MICKMKILYNIAAMSNFGGMECVLANKSNWLSDNGYEVIIVTTDQKGKPAFSPMFFLSLSPTAFLRFLLPASVARGTSLRMG